MEETVEYRLLKPLNLGDTGADHAKASKSDKHGISLVIHILFDSMTRPTVALGLSYTLGLRLVGV